MSKILVVFGATGVQGGSVIKAVQADPELSKQFKIRAITRDTTKPSAQALSKQGIEVTTANLDSKQSVLEALQGAHSVFAVTNFWEMMSKEKEVEQGKIVADAAVEAKVSHLIFSSLENVTEISKGQLPHVSHFDGKAEIESYIRGLDVPATFVLMGFYASNLPSSFNKGADGAYMFTSPLSANAQHPVLDTAADAGKFVTPALRGGPEKFNGRKILAAEKYYTPSEIVSAFESATSHKATYVQIPGETFKSYLGMPEDLAQEMLENFILMDTFGYYNKASLDESHALLTESDRKRLSTLENFFSGVEQWKS